MKCQIRVRSWAVLWGRFYAVMGGDDQYLSNLGMNVIDGRNFNEEFATDSAAVILHQTAVRRLGLTSPVGLKL